MTARARDGQGLEAHDVLAAEALDRMAGGAGDRLVLAVERVPAVAGVHEAGSRPEGVGVVAALAARGARDGELAGVDVAMTAGAIEGALDERELAGPVARVTSDAGDACMLADEREARLVVLDGDRAPARGVVAGGATLRAREAIQRPAVRIAMAIAAGGAGEAILPRPARGRATGAGRQRRCGDLAMAGDARNGEVRALEWIATPRVLVGAEAGRLEARDIVAVGAGAHRLAGCHRRELAGVPIGVAGLAARESWDAKLAARRVATLARHRAVAASQGVGGAVVVDAAHFRGPKGRGRVAGGAVGAEPALVDVGVAGGTVGNRPVLELREQERGGGASLCLARLLVAVQARRLGVRSHERVARTGMVEAGGTLPGLLAVTVGAGGGRERPLVRIGVAGRTGALEPEVGTGEIDARLRGAERRSDSLGPVAVPAGRARVLAFEPPAGFRMVEGSLAHLPTYERELAAVVFRVAALAALVIGAGVRPQAGANAPTEGAMAVETEGGVDALAGAMAGEAGAIPLERGVGRGQRARRDLRSGPRRAEAQPERREREASRRRGAAGRQPGPRA